MKQKPCPPTIFLSVFWSFGSTAGRESHRLHSLLIFWHSRQWCSPPSSNLQYSFGSWAGSQLLSLQYHLEILSAQINYIQKLTLPMYCGLATYRERVLTFPLSHCRRLEGTAEKSTFSAHHLQRFFHQTSLYTSKPWKVYPCWSKTCTRRLCYLLIPSKRDTIWCAFQFSLPKYYGCKRKGKYYWK